MLAPYKLIQGPEQEPRLQVALLLVQPLVADRCTPPEAAVEVAAAAAGTSLPSGYRASWMDPLSESLSTQPLLEDSKGSYSCSTTNQMWLHSLANLMPWKSLFSRCELQDDLAASHDRLVHLHLKNIHI